MIDREKVIKGFQCCFRKKCSSCPYVDYENCIDFLEPDVFELLNGQNDIVVCKDCKRFNKSSGVCKKGHAHGYADTWFCADGERRPEVGPNEAEPVPEFEENEKGIFFRWRCRECCQELRKDVDLFCPHCGRRVMWELSGFQEESEEGITHYD